MQAQQARPRCQGKQALQRTSTAAAGQQDLLQLRHCRLVLAQAGQEARHSLLQEVRGQHREAGKVLWECSTALQAGKWAGRQWWCALWRRAVPGPKQVLARRLCTQAA
jgi:hypothetical protein